MSKMINDYEIVKELGNGTDTHIFLVTKNSSDNKNYYVIKQINLEGLSLEEKKFFKNEANILSKIKSEYVVKFIEDFEENNCYNIVMEYYEGGDLQKFLEERKKIPLNDNFIWKLFIQIVIGLGEIHNMNILHRDLKTPNIFLTKNNDIRIGDLGIAKQLLRFRFTNTVIGTPYYLSPEICKNKPYNEKSDIWALGCVLYELCTFNHPFESTNQASLIKKILEQNPKPIPTTFDYNFNILVKQLLQKEKNKRPSCKIILKLPYVMKKAKELRLYHKYQKLIGYKINIINSNETKNNKKTQKNFFTIENNDKNISIPKRPNSNMKNKIVINNPLKNNQKFKNENNNKANNPFTSDKKNFKHNKISKLPIRDRSKNKLIKNKKEAINIKINTKKNHNKSCELNLMDTIEMNKKRFNKSGYLKTQEELKTERNNQILKNKKLPKENNKRAKSYRDLFNSQNKSIKLSSNDSVKVSLNQMISDFQPEKQPEVNNFIYNSPKIKDSEEEFKKNEKSSAIKASAFHIYYNKENKNNEMEDKYSSESDEEKNSNIKSNKKEYEGSDNKNDIEDEKVKTIYNRENNSDIKFKEKENSQNKNYIEQTRKELNNLIGMNDFQKIMQILLFTINITENQRNEKINEIIQNYESDKKEKFNELYCRLISMEPIFKNNE